MFDLFGGALLDPTASYDNGQSPPDPNDPPKGDLEDGIVITG